MITVSAPGKIILSGEHAVVHGYPAILAAVNRRLTVTLSPVSAPASSPHVQSIINSGLKAIGVPRARISFAIDSQIPIGAGMGSSAALATAISAALLYKYRRSWDQNQTNSLAYAAEKFQHGHPSGADNTISCFGGFLWYRKESDSFKCFSPIPVSAPLPPLLLINTGQPLETTGEMVSSVWAMSRASPQKTAAIFSRIEQITREWLKIMIGESSAPLAGLIHNNERLLEQLHVVSPSTQTLIRQIEKLGGAAKMSGGGGLKGASGLIIAYHPHPEVLRRFASRHRLKIISVKLGAEGVRLEKK